MGSGCYLLKPISLALAWDEPAPQLLLDLSVHCLALCSQIPTHVVSATCLWYAAPDWNPKGEVWPGCVSWLQSHTHVLCGLHALGLLNINHLGAVPICFKTFTDLFTYHLGPWITFCGQPGRCHWAGPEASQARDRNKSIKVWGQVKVRGSQHRVRSGWTSFSDSAFSLGWLTTQSSFPLGKWF